ncbi:Pol polyprotein [Elysia marginata]|uniref:Pol polyprotein n=1 Tax=Elysia marginata TaxID=1093978 RepID=A0AAV4I2H9_9GAST|nr:Pol polyprotein [Elysia marginata]
MASKVSLDESEVQVMLRFVRKARQRTSRHSDDILAVIELDESRTTYEETLVALDACFNRRVQQPSESVDSFIQDIHKLADKCSYLTLKDELIRDRIVLQKEWALQLRLPLKQSQRGPVSTSPPLNKAVLQEVHPLSSVDDDLARLAGSRVFTKLDARSGFWQMPLDSQSRLLTTSLIPFGRFCMNRLPFGISSAPEIFQRRMSEILRDIEGVICHMDDILVHAPS